MKQSNAPDVLVDPVLGDILAALADHDGNFALIVEALGAFRIGNLLLRTRNLVRILPKSPLAFFFGQLGDLRQIARNAGPTRPHAGQMRGVVTAHTSDAPLGPGRVELNILSVVDDGFYATLGRMLDGALSVFDGCFSQGNETLQSPWDLLVGASFGVGLAALVAQIVGQRAVQVDDLVILPCADTALRAKKDDLHCFLLLLLFKVPGSKFKVRFAHPEYRRIFGFPEPDPSLVQDKR